MIDNSYISVLNLSKWEAPQLAESREGEWVQYMIDGLSYYDYLAERFHNSPTNNAVINNMARLAYGRGLNALNASRRPMDFAKMKSLIDGECLRNLFLELIMQGAGHVQVHYNKQHTKIEKAYHIPTRNINPEKCNKDGDIEGYYYSDNWYDTKKFPPKRFPAFGTSKEQIEILCIRPYSVGSKYFSEVPYHGCLPYTILEEEIANYLINDVQNGFAPTTIINFNNGVPPEEKRREIADDVERKLTGSKGKKTITSFNQDETKKANIETIPLNDAPQHYEYLSKECEGKILVGHNITSPMIVGVVTDNQGFSSNADEIEVAAKYFYNTAIRPFQDLVIEGIDKLLSFNGLSLDLYFRRLNLLEDFEADQQAKEETSVRFSSDLTALLSTIGEDVPEDWELIDEREVNYELEEELDTQLSEYEAEISKPTGLSKIVSLIGTGRAAPNQPSNQDREIDGFYFKVRYKYDGSERPERDFCRAMMRANKVYRKEDIEKMSSQGINKSHGHNGQPYDLFLYKGGVYCEHRWIRQTYVSASKTASIGSPKTNQISREKARKFGYKVNNPSEVGIYPKYQRANGRHPQNPDYK